MAHDGKHGEVVEVVTTREPDVQVISEGRKHGGHDSSLVSRLGDFERWAVEEVLALEKNVVNHHSAAYIMLAVAILGFLSGIMISSEQPPLLLDAHSDSAEVCGFVTNETGDPLGDAVVTVKGSELRGTTNSDGYFYLGYLPVGVYEVSASAPNHTAITMKVRFTGEGAQMLAFSLEEGGGYEYIEDLPPAPPPSFWTLTSLVSLFIFLMSTLTIIGAGFAYYGKKFRFVLVCATASVLTFGFIAGSVLGIFALVFVMLSKNDFDDPAKNWVD